MLLKCILGHNCGYLILMLAISLASLIYYRPVYCNAFHVVKLYRSTARVLQFPFRRNVIFALILSPFTPTFSQRSLLSLNLDMPTDVKNIFQSKIFNKTHKQVWILIRRLVTSRSTWIYNVCKGIRFSV